MMKLTYLKLGLISLVLYLGGVIFYIYVAEQMGINWVPLIIVSIGVMSVSIVIGIILGLKGFKNLVKR